MGPDNIMIPDNNMIQPRFPTPKGFTTDRAKAWKHKLTVSFAPQTASKLNLKARNNKDFHDLGYSICKFLKIRKQNITTTIKGVSYTLVNYTSSNQTDTKKTYTTLCVFGWIKTKKIAYSGSKYIEKDSPTYYPLF